MAGLGITRTCTELRIWDNERRKLLKPGTIQDSASLGPLVARDEVTSGPYWVLRDGLQVHWRSENADEFDD